MGDEPDGERGTDVEWVVDTGQPMRVAISSQIAATSSACFTDSVPAHTEVPNGLPPGSM